MCCVSVRPIASFMVKLEELLEIGMQILNFLNSVEKTSYNIRE